MRALGEVAPEQELVLFHGAAPAETRLPAASLARPGLRLEPTAAPLASAREQVDLPRAARRLGLDLFYSPFPLGPLRLPCPRALVIHDLIPLARPETVPSPVHRRLLPLATRAALASAALVLTPSRATLDAVRARWPGPAARIPIAVVPYAPAPSLRPSSDAEVARLRASLGLARPYVLFLGAHRPHKNLVRLVEAWATLLDGPAGARTLVLAGAGDARFPAVRDRCRALGLTLGLDSDAVRFPGVIAERDLAALYAGAELFVLPSLDEGFGLPVLEAMACGTAVACARAGALPEVAGDAAAYFDPDDTSSIAEVLGALLAAPARRAALAAAGARRAATFSWHETAERTLAACYHLLEGQS